ncbi:Smr/MutS family protein [Paracoccus sp. (in: a-proteobacteria)]|uniref:Smr/MutS family protein n=1 Tax=Paracoccus sp. TaxID=267 RepID=UPI0039E26D21
MPPKRPASKVTLAPHPGHALHDQPVRMDHKTHRRMSQGKLMPEARLDLHGMTLNMAQPALTGFLLNAQARGLRLVLVITGKGRDAGPDAPLPVRSGALRHNVPHWLHMPPLAGLVLQIRPAHRRHGGDGAYYVYLRR